MTPWNISDQPDFTYRGLLVDVARTYLPIETLKTIVDGCLYSKINVVHLHLTDSQSFPLWLTTLTDITVHGATSADKVYTPDMLRELVNYAALRGVRIIPEIDTPGHSRSFGLSPETKDIVACAYEKDWEKSCAEPPCGQLNPTLDKTYTVLQYVFYDLVLIFKDPYIHLGYDEINHNCWLSDAGIAAYLQQHNQTVGDLLLTYFQRQRALLASVAADRRFIYWEEASMQDPQLPIESSDVVQVWSNKAALQAALVNTSADVLISWSSNVYLDCGAGNMFGDDSWCDPYKTWWTMYSADPLNGTLPNQRSRVRGGTAAMWGELATPGVVVPRTFPRATAYAGRLW
ncbi:uncharacterized protein MONBRDRAFT_15452, partial [Monosiga brevicollis MX1]